MTTCQSETGPFALDGPVVVTLKRKADCVGDPQLAEFCCADGPAAEEVRIILGNLLSGEAVEQTVAMLKEERTGALLGIASVRMDGNAQIRGRASVPWFVRRISVNPYVNVVARDERYRNHVLRDGETRLGVALVRAALEVVEHELDGAPMPTVWALIKRGNTASKRAFRRLAFYPHARSRENQQDVFVRKAGRALPPPPDAAAYRPIERVRAVGRITA
jgi:hypothetical protein